MMESADEVLLTEATPPLHIIETDTQCLSHPDGRMVFHCRPDLSGRRLLFQDRNSRATNTNEKRQPTPVQLLTMDGRSLLGLSATSISSNESSLSPIQDDEKLPRILVTTNPLTDASSECRLRRMQLTITAAAVFNLIFTVALLCPADTDAWYHVDAYQSPTGLENVQRVLAVRPILLVIALLSNGLLVLATYFRLDALLNVYISVIGIVDLWSLISLLPHALFLLRFLFDVLLIGIVLEVRTQLEQTWFLTSFHRLRA